MMLRIEGKYTIMIDDVLLNKAATIEKCIKRIKEESTDIELLRANYTKQDSVILNLQSSDSHI